MKNGVVVDYQRNWKNRGYDTAVIVAPIKIAGIDYYQGCVITRSIDKNTFYLHEVAQIKKDGTSPFKTESLGRDLSGNVPSVMSILHRLIDVNTSSEKNFDEISDFYDRATMTTERIDNLIADSGAVDA